MHSAAPADACSRLYHVQRSLFSTAEIRESKQRQRVFPNRAERRICRLPVGSWEWRRQQIDHSSQGSWTAYAEQSKYVRYREYAVTKGGRERTARYYFCGLVVLVLTIHTSSITRLALPHLQEHRARQPRSHQAMGLTDASHSCVLSRLAATLSAAECFQPSNLCLGRRPLFPAHSTADRGADLDLPLNPFGS